MNLDASGSSPSEPPLAPVDVPSIACWRCGLTAPADVGRCPHCAARLTPSIAAAETRPSAPQCRAHAEDGDAVKSLFTWYTLLLATGIVHSFILQIRFSDEPQITAEISQQILYQVAIFEVIDTLIVIGAYLNMPRAEHKLPHSNRWKISAWAWATPVLLALLGLNFAYHAALRQFLRIPPLETEIREVRSWLTLVTVCVQPALVEEAFYRGLTMTGLRRVVGLHSAIWISATMFALFHVAVILSMPYLFLVGLALGYLRAAGGTIWLPIIVHFLHNLAVLTYEWI